MNDFEKRWQRISQLLQVEATGQERPMVSSGRTLFGIKSSVEEKMDQFAKEIEDEYAAKRKAEREARRTATQNSNATQNGHRNGYTEKDVNASDAKLSGDSPSSLLSNLPANSRSSKPISPLSSPSSSSSSGSSPNTPSSAELVDRVREKMLADATARLEEQIRKQNEERTNAK